MMDDLVMKDLFVQTKNWDKPLGGASDADVDIKDIIELLLLVIMYHQMWFLNLMMRNAVP